MHILLITNAQSQMHTDSQIRKANNNYRYIILHHIIDHAQK